MFLSKIALKIIIKQKTASTQAILAVSLTGRTSWVCDEKIMETHINKK